MLVWDPALIGHLCCIKGTEQRAAGSVGWRPEGID